MGKGEVCTGCWWGNLRERGRWGDPDVCGRIILRSSGSRMWGIDWIELAQDMDRWRALVNAAMNLRVA
jgi:hypothetical protein